MSSKKAEQLGMNPSTASGRLVKDLLWNYIVKSGHDNCHKCGCKMSRETFSIEHIIPWLDTHDPVGLFFDLDNISFSHLTCNVESRRISKSPCGTYSSYRRGCRCEMCKSANAKQQSSRYTPEARRKRYLSKGV